MTSVANVYVMLNPASAAGKTRVRSSVIVKAMKQALGKECSIHLTRSQNDAPRATAEAIKQGAKLVIAVGGDGTVHEVVNGFFEQGKLINPDCELGIVASGSGRDIAKNVGLPRSWKAQVQCLADGQARRIDVGRVTFRDLKGQTSTQYFVNECQVGIGGEVVRRVQQFHKRFGGTLAFASESVRALFRYRSPNLSVQLGEKEMLSGAFLGLVIANGSLMGGGMKLAPEATLDDGLFDLLVVPDYRLLRRLWSFFKIYRGTHLTVPGMKYLKTEAVKVTSEETTLVATDGELLGTTPCEVVMLKSALNVRCPSNSGNQF
jgi:YegS/Rv2252/BmrU family lipid kinase